MKISLLNIEFLPKINISVFLIIFIFISVFYYFATEFRDFSMPITRLAEVTATKRTALLSISTQVNPATISSLNDARSVSVTGRSPLARSTHDDAPSDHLAQASEIR